MLLAAACNNATEEAAAPSADVAEAKVPAGPATRPVADDVLTASGVANVRAGMTIAEVKALGRAVTVTQPPEAGSTCGYARIEGINGVMAMLDDEKLVRFDVIGRSDEAGATRSWRTAEGAGIGTTETELRRLYGDRLTIEPHKYTGPQGHYAILHGEDDAFGIIFETDGTRVLNWRVGQWEQVQWVEGCF